MKQSFRIRNRFSYAATEESGEKETLRALLDAVSHPIDSETVYAHGSLYRKVFGGTLKGSDRKRRFVKITSAATGRSVYRTLRGVPVSVRSEGILYIDSDGMHVLCDPDIPAPDGEVELSLKKCGWLGYYWNTSSTMVRVTFRIGMVSLVIGTVSLALGIAPFLLAR